MSRSYKKPYHSITTNGARAGMQKSWKKKNERKVRQADDFEGNEPPSYYKRINDPWGAPNDGKCYDPDWKKSHRK